MSHLRMSLVLRANRHARAGRLRSLIRALLGGTLAVLLLRPPSVAGESLGGKARGPSVWASAAALELDGDSSLHRYTLKARDMQVGIVVDDARIAQAVHPPDIEALILGHFIKTFQLVLPIDKLSSNDSHLDANMRKAMKNKEILFQMDSYDVVPPAAANAAMKVELHGRLNLAGVERKIDVAATGVQVAGGIRLSGQKDLLMTDYQIKPPVLMLGAIKTANLVTVKFNTTLQQGVKQ